MYFNMIAHIDLNDLPLLATASQFPVNLHLWSGKDPHRPNFLELVILGKGLYGLNLPYLRLLNFWTVFNEVIYRPNLDFTAIFQSRALLVAILCTWWRK